MLMTWLLHRWWPGIPEISLLLAIGIVALVYGLVLVNTFNVSAPSSSHTSQIKVGRWVFNLHRMDRGK